ncbi:MAG TPA: glycerophosphodiester phosphodiesterase family protein [Anaerolineales bacterium]|nr:glycerophosphodiester phosphodiesterase family protein [Anaerolineales bacterium]
MFEGLSRPLVFAHRGASAHAPENTLASFELALSHGADVLELDVRLSADGRVVVIHDSTVDRTTNGHGRVAQLTLAELRSLDAGSFFSEKYRGEKIPLLEEVLDAVGKKTFLNVELKDRTTPHDQLVEYVCALVAKYGLEKRVMFSSVLASNLGKAKRILPEVPRGLLALEGWMGAWARSFGFSFGDYIALHPCLTDVTKQQIVRVHRLKRRVHVWTVNQAEDIARLKTWGVDGIFTDDPQSALQALERLL